MYMRQCYLKKTLLHPKSNRLVHERVEMNTSIIARTQQVGTQFLGQIYAHKPVLRKFAFNSYFHFFYLINLI